MLSSKWFNRLLFVAIIVVAGVAAAIAQQGAGPLVSGSGIFPFGGAFPPGGTPIGAKNGTNFVNLAADASNNLDINCVVGCAGGTASNASDAVATTATNGTQNTWLFGFNGTTWDRLRVDGSKNLNINCAAGCTAGTTSNASDAVATSATNGAQVVYNYGFNASTGKWDRVRVDANDNTLVNISPNSSTLNINNQLVSGFPVAVGAGFSNLGTERVVIATNQPAIGTLAQQSGTWQFNIAANGTTILPGQTTMAASLPVVVASNQSNIPINIGAIGGSSLAIGQAAMAASIPVAIASNQSAVPASQSGTWNVVASGAVGLAPATSGGLSMSRTLVANNTSSIVVKASAGQLFTIHGYSISSATPVFVKFYNSTSQSCGSGTPVWEEMIPAAGATAGSGFVSNDANGLAFSTGISMCITGGYADNDATAPAASTYIVNVGYK